METHKPTRRRVIALALVALASLAAFAAVMAIWVDRQVLDTDNWTGASSELLERPVVRDRVAAYLTDQLYENVDVEGQIAAALPDQADDAGVTAAIGPDRFHPTVRAAVAACLEQERANEIRPAPA